MGATRVAATLAVAALLAVEVARLTAAHGLAESRTVIAASLAPRSPEVLVSTAMAGVGAAAARGQLPDAETMARLQQLARVAPLDVRPLLVDAAIAQKQGDVKRAEQLLLEARRLDPRSTAARFLLSDLWLREGRIAEGLNELAILSRLFRGSTMQLVPALASFAKTPGAAGELRQVLASNPQLKVPLLNALAADPANARLILELEQGTKRKPGEASPPWQGVLLDGMIRQGAFDQAQSYWRQLSDSPPDQRQLLFNGEFRSLSAPPPFNWRFTSTGAGFAEPGNGSMRVLHYGREAVSLASQLLLLEPGKYRFSVAVQGSAAPGALVWTMTCLPGSKVLLQMPVGRSGGQTSGFAVPADCRAQRLELLGKASDMPKQSDVRLGPASIERTGA